MKKTAGWKDRDSKQERNNPFTLPSLSDKADSKERKEGDEVQRSDLASAPSSLSPSSPSNKHTSKKRSGQRRSGNKKSGQSFFLPLPSGDIHFSGKQDTYLLKSTITREDAHAILQQTGFEIPIHPGKASRSNYVLAQGGFGRFCVGYAEKEKRYVGIKITEGDASIKQELLLHQSLAHASHHILPILDYCETQVQGRVVLYQVLEFAGLGSVKQLKDTLRVLDVTFRERVVFCLAEGLLQGLSDMHSMGFYHLDVKPANLVVRQDGRVFLIDFGCSAKGDKGIVDIGAAPPSDIDFASPERQAAGEAAHYDCDGAKIDAWAAGLTLLILTQMQYSYREIEDFAENIAMDIDDLFDSKSETEISEALEQYAKEQLAKLPWLSHAKENSLEALILQLLHPNAKERLSPTKALQHPWFTRLKTESASWRKEVNEYLREFVQSLSRETRNLGPQELPLAAFTSFIERGVQVTLMQRLLKSSYEESSYTVCQGMGGVGKTQLATFLVHHPDIEKRFGRKLWFRQADNPSYLEMQTILLARELGLIDDKAGIHVALPKLQAFLLEEAQRTQKPWLMVFDNADTPQSLTPYLAFKGGHCLVTTRNPSWDNSVPIDVMNERESQTLVNTLLQKETPDALPLCKALGFLPLGIVQACAYIRAENLAVLDYIQRLEKSSALLERDERSFGKKLPASILGMWELVFGTLKDKYPEAFTLLEALSVLAPDAIPQKLLDTLGTKASLAILQRYALVQVSQNVGSLHRLLQLATQYKSHRTLPEILSQAMQALDEIYDFAPATLESIQANRLLLSHGEALYQKYHDIPSPSKTLQTNFYHTLLWRARLAKELADYHKQKTLLEKALTLSETLYGKEHPSVATSLNNLGSVYETLGDAKKAIEYYERALVIDEKTYGKEHPDVATSLSGLGTAYQALGDAKKAIEYYERARVIYEKTYGKEHPDVATSLNNLGMAYDELGDSQKAIEYYEQARVIKEKVYGKEHPSVATSLNNLGMAYDELGDSQKAIEYCERALGIWEKVYGQEHPHVAMSLNNLGAAYDELGNAKKAIEYHERALVIYEKVYGKEHPHVATSLDNLGEAYRALGDAKKAIEYCERARMIFEKIYGKEHPSVATSLNNLGAAYDALGDAKKAIEYHERALVIYEKVYGQEHPHVAMSLNNLGAAYDELGNAKKAIEYHERALVIYEKVYGKEHRESRKTRELLNALTRSIDNNRVREVHENKATAMTMTPFTPLRHMQQNTATNVTRRSDKKDSKRCTIM